MEAYPPEYYEHNLPLVLLSGLRFPDNGVQDTSRPAKAEQGVRITMSSEECHAPRLLEQFQLRDGTDLPWNSASLPGPTGILKCRMSAIGRTFHLPPRKAAPLPQSPSAEGSDPYFSPPVRTELHSPLSPLSPGSPIFPDGLWSPLWLSKHQKQVPAMLIAFFNMPSGDGDGDEQIKNDINSAKAALARSGFRTKFAAVLLGDQTFAQAPDLEERTAAIRRATALDSRTGLFVVLSTSPEAELSTSVQNILSALQPLVVEYYRDLTKHARRKKGRSNPAPSVQSPAQTLSVSGWNVRYEAKQGIFAEFRQEMDVAERHYSAAIEELFLETGPLETLHSWSPRFNEARLFCDWLALRDIRCLLWNGLTSAAVQSWTNYRLRMRSLIQRRGKGIETYSWDAWEARWAEMMAQLIDRAQIPGLQPSLPVPQQFLNPEKAFANADRLPPFDCLHHTGYWRRIAFGSAVSRRARASAIPAEHRSPPGESPASAVAQKSSSYDSYLVPEPHEEAPLQGMQGYDHFTDMALSSEAAAKRFEQGGQARMAALTRLTFARELVRAGRLADALTVLLGLWNSSKWRAERWTDLLSSLLQLLHVSARHQSDAETFVGVSYELLSIPSAVKDELEFSCCLDGLSYIPDEKLLLSYEGDERLSPVAAYIAFAHPVAYVGEPLDCQLTLSSCLRDDAGPAALASATFVIGSAKTITITHSSDAVSSEEVEFIHLNNDTAISDNRLLESSANLSFLPGQRRVFNFELVFREDGLVRADSASLCMETEHFQITHRFTDSGGSKLWLSEDQGTVYEQLLTRPETNLVVVQPKPPKAQMHLQGLQKSYYNDQLIKLTIDVTNGEAETMKGTINATVLDDASFPPRLSWSTTTGDGNPERLGSQAGHELPGILSSQSQQAVLLVHAPAEPSTASVGIDLEYVLVSAPSTTLRKQLVVNFDFIQPFDAKFNFGPLLWPTAWPSYFTPEHAMSTQQPSGVPQLWRLSSQLRCLVTDGAYILGTELAIDRVIGDSKGTSKLDEPVSKELVKSGSTIRSLFEIHTQKNSLDDRRPTTIEAHLIIRWSLEESSPVFLTTLPVPLLTLPASEPRVLCTLEEEASPEGDVTVSYTVENPSAHFLTFALTMLPSADFGFSGPKHRSLSLVPLSRHRVEYRISLYDRDADDEGRWIFPALQVVDTSYQKQLRIHAGGKGVKTDEKGRLGVWID